MNNIEHSQIVTFERKRTKRSVGLFLSLLLLFVLAFFPATQAEAACTGSVSTALTASPNFLRPDDVVSYVVSATSQLTCNPRFRIVMPVPDHMTAKPHPGFQCSVPLVSGNCPSGALLSQSWTTTGTGKTRSYAFAMRLDSGATAPADGTVIAAAATVEAENVTSASATTVVQVDTTSGITLAASADVIGVVAGQSVTYTLTYGNRSGTALTGASLHATVPPVTTLQATDGAVSGDQIEWDLGTLPAGSHGKRQFTVKVNTTTPMGALFVMGADLRDDSGRVAGAGSANMVTPNNVSLSLTASPDPITPGGLVSYVVSATSQLASNPRFRIVMPVPDHMTAMPHPGFQCSVQSASGDCPSGAVLSQSWTTTGAGKTRSYAFAMRLDSGATAPVDGTVIAAAATVEAENVTSASATTVVQVDTTGGITLAASADVIGVVAGQSVTYTLTYGNRSGTALTGASLHATVPPVTTLQATDGAVSGDQIKWDLGTLPAGSHGKRQFTVKVNTTTPTGALFVMGADLRDDWGRVAGAGSANMITPNNVSLSLTASPDPVTPGDLVSYVVSATSQLASSPRFRIVMPVPDHMTAKPHPDFSCSVPLVSGNCPSGALLSQSWITTGAGQTRSYAFAMRLDGGASASVNGAVIAAAATVEAENVTSASAQVANRVAGPPLLSISSQSFPFNNVTLGMSKDTKFTVTNVGGGTLIGSASTSAPFSIVSGGSFSLSAGASQPVTVRFSPNTTGSFNSNVSFTTNGGNNSIMVSGTGSVQATTVNLGGNSTSNQSASFAEPVNTATGNYYYQHTDLALPGRGLPLSFTRTLNVQDASVGPFGPGWTHSYNLKLTENTDGSVVIKMGDGHEEFYDSLGSGAYQAHDPGVFNTLVKNGDGSFALTQKNQTRMAFTSAGRLSTINDRNGNSLSFAYNGASNISTITDTVGRVVTLSYDANNQLVSLTDPFGRAVTYSYDANGRLISDTDPNGGVMQYHYTAGVLDTITDRRDNTLIANTYDANKRVVSQTNGKGAVTQFAYDTPAVGQTSMTDPLGHVTIHTHDILRRLVKETDPLGHNVNTVYDANNNRTSVTDKNGKITAFTYDTQGNVLTKTDAQGKVTTLEYNSLNDPTRIVDTLGHVTTFAYDAKGNLNEVTDAQGHKTNVAYDSSGQPASVTNALGAVTQNTFNTQGNLIQVEDALGHKTTFSYDAIGRRTGMTDANGHASSFSYDDNGNLLSVTDPLGHKTSFSYDANNNRTGVTDPRGNAAAFVYDANDLLSKAIDPLGNFVQFAYDAADNRIKVTDPRGNITQYAYDAANRLTQVTDALNHATTLAYDANGNLLTETNPLGHTSSFAYDELNRLLNATDAMGNKGFRSYDALGRLTQAKDAKGRITQYTYDALGRLTKVTDAKGGTVVYDYDALGNRIAVTDPNGHKTGYSYDALNRLSTKTDPLGQAYNYSYDPVGNRINLIDAKGQNLLYSYDSNNRLTTIDYPDNTQVSFAYDAAGNRTRMIDKQGTSTYVFDALNRLDEYTDAFGKTVGNEYDPAGNRTALIYPDGKRVTYSYDPLNRMASVTDWLNGVTDYSYDAASKLAEVLNPNGTKAVYGYDAAERLVNLANAKADTSVLASYALTLDAVGNRSGINRSEPLTPIFTNKTQALTFDNDNRLLTLDAAAVTHDPNGNLTAEPGKNFQYDFEDRLVAANGNQSAQFSYDGVGNRMAATRNGQITRYTLDVSGAMSNVLVENDGVGNPTAYYVHGMGLISRITPSGDARYYHYDTIGSTVALTNAVGNVTDSYAYDPFGQVLNAQGTVNNPFRYVGQFGVMQEGNGLQFMRARYYEAGVGRFLNKDPLTGNFVDNRFLNRYVYTLDNPLTLIDVDGKSVLSWVAGIGVAATAIALAPEITVGVIVLGVLSGLGMATGVSKIENMTERPFAITSQIQEAEKTQNEEEFFNAYARRYEYFSSQNGKPSQAFEDTRSVAENFPGTSITAPKFIATKGINGISAVSGKQAPQIIWGGIQIIQKSIKGLFGSEAEAKSPPQLTSLSQAYSFTPSNSLTFGVTAFPTSNDSQLILETYEPQDYQMQNAKK